MPGSTVNGNGHSHLYTDPSEMHGWLNGQTPRNNHSGGPDLYSPFWSNTGPPHPLHNQQTANFFNRSRRNSVASNATLFENEEDISDTETVAGDFPNHQGKGVFSRDLKLSELEDIRDIIARNSHRIDKATFYQHIKAVLENANVDCEQIFNEDLSLKLDTPQGEALAKQAQKQAEKKDKKSLWKNPWAIGGGVAAGFAGLSVLTSLPLLLMGGGLGAAFIFPMIFGGLMQGLGMGATAGGMAAMYKKFLPEGVGKDEKDETIKEKLMESLKNRNNGLRRDTNFQNTQQEILSPSEPTSNDHPTANDVAALRRIIQDLQMQIRLLSSRVNNSGFYNANGGLYNSGWNNNLYNNNNWSNDMNYQNSYPLRVF